MQRYWWIHLVRGIFALAVGALILGWPVLAHSVFVNFIAIFWLVSGVTSLQWGFSRHQRKGLWLVAGMAGTIVGLALLLRSFYAHYLAQALAIRIFGVVAVLIGLANVSGGFRTEMTHEPSRGRLFLGLFEIGLGVLLLTLDTIGPFSRLVAGGWAFVGGVVLILQALHMRRSIRAEHAL